MPPSRPSLSRRGLVAGNTNCHRRSLALKETCNWPAESSHRGTKGTELFQRFLRPLRASVPLWSIECACGADGALAPPEDRLSIGGNAISAWQRGGGAGRRHDSRRGRRRSPEDAGASSALNRATTSHGPAGICTNRADFSRIRAAGSTILLAIPRFLLAFGRFALKFARFALGFARFALAFARFALAFARIESETGEIVQIPALERLAISAGELRTARSKPKSARNGLRTGRSVQTAATTFLFSGAGVLFPAQTKLRRR
jgi:hypothetical protein